MEFIQLERGRKSNDSLASLLVCFIRGLEMSESICTENHTLVGTRIYTQDMNDFYFIFDYIYVWVLLYIQLHDYQM